MYVYRKINFDLLEIEKPEIVKIHVYAKQRQYSKIIG